MAGSALAQKPARPDGRFRGESFVFARYGSSGSASLYAAQRFGRAALLAGVSVNTRTDARTFLAGAGTRLICSRNAGLGLFIAAGKAPEGAVAQVYALPRVGLGSFSLSATAALTEPFESRGARRLTVNPLTLAVRLAEPLQVGLATTHDWTRNKPGRHGIGPMTQLRTRFGSVAVERLRFASQRRDETRLSVAGRW
jgi:hypothetical protein